jgi:hypothetical protein
VAARQQGQRRGRAEVRAERVVVKVQLPAGQEETVPGIVPASRVQHALSRAVHFDLGGDQPRTAAQWRAGVGRNVADGRVVNVVPAPLLAGPVLTNAVHGAGARGRAEQLDHPVI